ncbi:protein kinase [Achlya hypogyna]|uniref:Protein kinase n=1 Tax=Achlya hypogyna TaxID=1202772 RepID=A0A1V9YR53_ACHHY|nr:protein kinase [Achlya hypogyna]
MESPYIVQTLGASWRIPSELQMVLEWMDRGDLKNVLDSTTLESYPWVEKTHTMISVIEGLVFLHSLNVIHRDLKSRNILVDSVKGAKLTDFGVSREVTAETMTIGVGTYRWMAPEILLHNHYSVAADIYSFGVVLAELSTHKIPFSDVLNDNGSSLVDTAIMTQVANGTIKPTLGSTCPGWVRKLAESCLAWSADDRPTTYEIAHIIYQHIEESL